MNSSTESRSIVIGGGCFWCVEAIFAEVKGVISVLSGYAGGKSSDPTYEQVCSGSTGHAEVVRVTFDPALITLKNLLRIFITTHDPTTPNRQGADRGTQYRSAIFFEEPEHEEQIKEVIEEIEEADLWPDPIVTEVKALEAFYPAEEYHRDYFKKHPDAAYCRIMIQPKLSEFRAKYATQLK